MVEYTNNEEYRGFLSGELGRSDGRKHFIEIGDEGKYGEIHNLTSLCLQSMCDLRGNSLFPHPEGGWVIQEDSRRKRVFLDHDNIDCISVRILQQPINI